MKFFESKYALAITLGLLSTQVYLSKSFVIDNTNYQFRSLAQSNETLRCTIPSDIKDIDNFSQTRNCFLNFNKDTKVFTVIMRAQDEDKTTYREATVELTNADLKEILGIDSNPTEGQISSIRNAEISKMAGTFIPKLRADGSFSVIRTDEENNDEDERIIVTTDDESEPEVDAEEDNSLSRAELRKILNEYEDLSKAVRRAKNKCTFDEDEADFMEVSETFEALSENFEDEKVSCEDRECSNLSEDDISLAKDLKNLLEDFPSKSSYTLSEGSEEINDCKDDKLNDEDFLEEYRKSACSEGDGSIRLGQQRDNLVTRFRRQNQNGPQPAVNETIARAQVCYYQNEILPDLRKGYATGNEALFNETLERAEDLAKSIDNSSDNTNEAIRTSLQLEPEIGMRLRLYEDALHDQIYKVSQSDLSDDQKATEIRKLKESAAAGFASDKAQISELLRNSNAMPAEVDLLMGSNGLFSFWGDELKDINNERQTPLGSGSKSHLAALAFSGLDQSTQDAIQAQFDGTEANVLDSNERALANAGVDPVRDQLNIVDQPVPRTLRETRAARRQELLDLHPRLHRAENKPTRGQRPTIENLGLGGDQNPRSNDPAVSFLNDDRRNQNGRRSEGRLSRDNESSGAIR